MLAKVAGVHLRPWTKTLRAKVRLMGAGSGASAAGGNREVTQHVLPSSIS